MTSRFAVKVWRSETQWADLSPLVMATDSGRPVVHRAVNRQGEISFKLTVGDAPLNPLLTSFNPPWSSGGAGALDWGMYVEVIDTATGVRLSDGIISTMTMRGRTLAVEVADWLTVLASQGGDIRRNYYSDSATYYTDATWSSGDSTIRSEIGGLGEPQTYSAEYLVYTPRNHYRDYSGDESSEMVDYSYPLYTRVGTGGVVTYYTVTWQVDTGGADQLRRLTDMELFITYGLTRPPTTGTLTLTVNGVSKALPFSITGAGVWRVSGYSADFSRVDVSGGCTVTVTAAFDDGDPPRALSGLYITGGINTAGGDRVNGQAGCISCKAEMYTLRGATASHEGSQLVISAIEGVDTMSSSLLDPDSSDRVRCTFITSELSTPEIMRQIGERLGYPTTDYSGSVLPAQDTVLSQLQTGGGYALDYLMLLADVTDSQGRGRSYACHGNPPALMLGARRMSTDAADADDLETTYGQAVPSVSQAVIMYEYAPTLTMKNRPSRSIYRGDVSGRTGDTTSYMILVVEDRQLTLDRGQPTDTLIAESGTSDVPSAASAAWGELAGDPEEWEGDLVLSGIVPRVIDSSGPHVGAGRVIKVTHPLSGQIGRRLVITEATWDYNTMTTKLTLSRASMRYSSAIPDTVALAVSTSSRVATGSDALSRIQFARLVSDSPVTLQPANALSVTAGGAAVTIDNPVRVDFPNGRTVIYGAVTGKGHITQKYGVTAVTLNGTTWQIPELERPDYYSGQTLVINVDVPTP